MISNLLCNWDLRDQPQILLSFLVWEPWIFLYGCLARKGTIIKGHAKVFLFYCWCWVSFEKDILWQLTIWFIWSIGLFYVSISCHKALHRKDTVQRVSFNSRVLYADANFREWGIVLEMTLGRMITDEMLIR